MTAKDYRRLAEALKESGIRIDIGINGQVDSPFAEGAAFALQVVSRELIAVLRSDNGRFNEDRFRAAAALPTA